MEKGVPVQAPPPKKTVPDSVPSDAASFLRAALTRDPDDRPTVERLAAHAWISHL